MSGIDPAALIQSVAANGGNAAKLPFDPPTNASGHQPPLATGGFLASDLPVRAPEATKR